MGIISGMMSGLGSGLEKAAEIVGKHFLQQQAEEADKWRLERLAELREKTDISAEQRKRAPYKEAQAATEKWKADTTTYAADVPGVATEIAPSEADVNKRLKQELLSRGEHTAAHEIGSEALGREKLDVEKASIGRREGQEQRQHEERMDILQRQLLVQKKQLARMYSLDKPQSTALTTNIEFMVKNDIAKDAAEAFNMLRTKMEKSPQQVLEQITTNLLRSSDYRYRGKDGRKNAVNDAREIISKIRGVEEEAFGEGFAKVQPGARSRRPLTDFLGGEE